MWIARNRELIRFFALLVLITAAASARRLFFVSAAAGIAVGGLGFILLLLFFLFSYYRYGKLRQLADYLRDIRQGQYRLAVQNYEEGELSILRSEIYKVTVLLEEQAKTLEKEKQQLADSMSDISHQLKTPLTSMLMMTDLLCEQPMDAATGKTFLLQIREQLERMQWLVSSLLKLAKLDAGAVTLKREPLTVFPLIHKAVAPLLVMMEDKGLSLEILGQDDAWIVADDHWTIEALTNIIKNCIEHTKVGGLKIRAVQTNLYTQIQIEDTGEGIAKADLPHIFKRFYKGKNADENSVGIGLAMAYSIIREQMGDIAVVSQEGRGTQFTIRFYR